MDPIDDLKSRLDIVEIVGSVVKLKKVGENYFGLCPFHNENTPSFSVNHKLQIFKCFGCGEGGDVIKFYMKYYNVNFVQAVTELSDRVGYHFVWRQNSFQRELSEIALKKEEFLKINFLVADYFNKKLLGYLADKNDNYVKSYVQSRKLDENVIQKFLIGFDDGQVFSILELFKSKEITTKDLLELGILVKKENQEISSKFRNRLIFPIFNEIGNIVGFSARIIPDNTRNSLPKYLNSPDSMIFNKGKLLFGLYQARDDIKRKGYVILCEGQMNVISSHKVGVENIVASLGTSFTNYQLTNLLRYSKNLYIAFDKDKAGKKALLRLLKIVFPLNRELNVKVLDWPEEYKDPDELINFDKNLWYEAVKNAYDPVDYLLLQFEKKNANKPNYMDVLRKFLSMVMPLIYQSSDLLVIKNYLEKVSFHLGLSIDILEQYRVANKDADKAQKLSTNPYKNSQFNNEVDKLKSINESFFALVIQNWQSLKYSFLETDPLIIDEDFIDIFEFLKKSIECEEVYQFVNGQNFSENSASNSIIKERLLNLLIKPLSELDLKIDVKKHFEKIKKEMAFLKYRYFQKEYKQRQTEDLLKKIKKLLKLVS